ncbi:MAG: PAS domain S-box protein [Verrucomicrobiota bacterium]
MKDPLPEAPQIMIVEDSPETRELLAQVFSLRGFKVCPVSSGALALQTALQTPPDLILLDIDLPDMNGYEVCERLKANDLLRPIPVIFISGLDGELDKVRAFGAGGVDYVTKPFNVGELEARVRTHLTLRDQARRLQLELAERQRAEAVLRAKEQQIRDVFEHAPVGIFHSSPGGRLLEANPALALMLGYASPEELIAATADMTTQIYADPTVRPKIMVALQENAGWVHRDAVVWRRKDGRLITVDMTGRKVCDDAGAIVYLEGLIVDITDRLRAEAALRESEKLFRTLVEFLPLIIYVCDGPEEKSQYVNPAFTRLTGYTLADVPIAKAWWELAYPDPAYREELRLEWLAREQRAREVGIYSDPMETTITCKDGSEKQILAGYIPLAEKKYIFAIDITERKQAEAALARVLAQRTEEWQQATTDALSASEEEARRIGHQLHETLCQDLIGISRQAEAVALAGVETERVSDAMADRLQRLASLAAAAAREARGLSHLLTISEPLDVSLEELLRWHVRQLEGIYGFRCELPLGETLPAWSPEQGMHIIRIIREALVNAARHAHARRVWLDCLQEKGQTVLSISSDGDSALDPETWKSGLGMRQMRMRAALLGATLTFRPGPQGVVVQLVLPQDS